MVVFAGRYGTISRCMTGFGPGFQAVLHEQPSTPRIGGAIRRTQDILAQPVGTINIQDSTRAMARTDMGLLG